MNTNSVKTTAVAVMTTTYPLTESFKLITTARVAESQRAVVKVMDQ